jgi:hypothetical protein
VGRAWEIGLVDGFADQGIDLGTADPIIGTSAGAVVGAQLALKQGFGAPPKIAAAIASVPPPVHSDSMADLGAAIARAAQSPEPELIRAEIGKMALNAQTVHFAVRVLLLSPAIGVNGILQRTLMRRGGRPQARLGRRAARTATTPAGYFAFQWWPSIVEETFDSSAFPKLPPLCRRLVGKDIFFKFSNEKPNHHRQIFTLGGGQKLFDIDLLPPFAHAHYVQTISIVCFQLSSLHVLYVVVGEAVQAAVHCSKLGYSWLIGSPRCGRSCGRGADSGSASASSADSGSAERPMPSNAGLAAAKGAWSPGAGVSRR